MTELREFRMPALGADMEKGTVLEWYVKPGDEVHRGQIVAEVDTAKSAIDIEVFNDGVIEELVVPPGNEVAVGTVLARLRPTGPAALVAPTTDGPAPEQQQTATGAAEPAGRARPGRRPPSRVAPPLRRLARDLAVDLSTLAGSGPQGQITRDDVLAAVRPPAPTPAVDERSVGTPAPGSLHAPTTTSAPPAPPQPGRVRISPLARRRAEAAGLDPAAVRGTGPQGAVTAADVAAQLSATAAPAEAAGGGKPPRKARPAVRPEAMREAIGALMTRSKQEIPHYYLATTVDLGAALGWLAERNAEVPPPRRVLPVALLLRATALAAAEHPDFNGHLVDGSFRPASGVRLGVPVSLRSGGLVTPSIEGADRLELAELNQRLRDLATRAKAGRLRGSEISDPSLTVTNLGDQAGVETVFGVIFPPQVALVGIGSVVQRPWAVDGLLGVRPVMNLTLSADHRVTDGHRGALFLQTICTHLTRPEEL